MALSATIVWEVRQTGSDANGGGFDPAGSGTDRSLQDAAQVAIDNATVTCTTPNANSNTLTFTAGYTPTAADVGNVVNITGGTNINAGRYSITAQTSTTWTLAGVLTLTTASGAGSAITGSMGGAFATPGAAAAAAVVSGQKIWVKYSATAYAVTTATAGAAGPVGLAATLAISMEGYDATRGDRTGNVPSYKWTAASPGANTYIFANAGGAHQEFANLKADGNSVANVSGFNGQGRGVFEACVAANCSGSGCFGFNNTASTTTFVRCQASSCTTGIGAAATATAHACDVSGGTTAYTGLVSASRCLGRGATTGFANVTGCYSCTSDGNTTGFSWTTSGANLGVNCLATNNGTGFALGASITSLHNCATYGNTADTSGTVFLDEVSSSSGLLVLSADPYVSRGSADFRPNTTSGGGASLRGSGLGVFGQTDNADIGAVQHSDPAGGGLFVPLGMNGGFAQ